jgi:hypothetical protein
MQRVFDAGLGNAGCLDDDLDARKADHRIGVRGDVGRARGDGLAERRGRELLRRPAGGGELPSCPPDIEVGDGDDVQALRQARLRQEHGAEFAGADHADPDGAARELALD